MNSTIEKKIRRANRVRRNQPSRGKRIRLHLHISNKFAYVQAIDDKAGHTIANSSTKLYQATNHTNVSALEWLGEAIGSKLIDMKQKDVYLDRGHRRYGPRLMAFADAARKVGLSL